MWVPVSYTHLDVYKRQDLACCELGADGYLVTDWLLDPIDFDYRAMNHGSLEDLLDFVTALPECS